jgi:hypothetical protein
MAIFRKIHSDAIIKLRVYGFGGFDTTTESLKRYVFRVGGTRKSQCWRERQRRIEPAKSADPPNPPGVLWRNCLRNKHLSFAGLWRVFFGGFEIRISRRIGPVRQTD